MMLIFGFLVVIVFIWMAKAGHFDDMDGAANRIFMDDEYPEDLGPEKTAEKPFKKTTEIPSKNQDETQTELHDKPLKNRSHQAD